MNTKAEKALVELVLECADILREYAQYDGDGPGEHSIVNRVGIFEAAYAEGPRAELQAKPREKPKEGE